MRGEDLSVATAPCWGGRPPTLPRDSSRGLVGPVWVRVPCPSILIVPRLSVAHPRLLTSSPSQVPSTLRHVLIPPRGAQLSAAQAQLATPPLLKELLKAQRAVLGPGVPDIVGSGDAEGRRKLKRWALPHRAIVFVESGEAAEALVEGLGRGGSASPPTCRRAQSRDIRARAVPPLSNLQLHSPPPLSTPHPPPLPT